MVVEGYDFTAQDTSRHYWLVRNRYAATGHNLQGTVTSILSADTNRPNTPTPLPACVFVPCSWGTDAKWGANGYVKLARNSKSPKGTCLMYTGRLARQCCIRLARALQFTACRHVVDAHGCPQLQIRSSLLPLLLKGRRFVSACLAPTWWFVMNRTAIQPGIVALR